MLKQVTFAASLLLAVQGIAFAQTKLPDRIVSYGDLDLSKPADIRTLDRRLSWAVLSSCPDDRGVGARQAAQACRKAKRAEMAVVRTRALAAAQSSTELAAVKQ